MVIRSVSYLSTISGGNGPWSAPANSIHERISATWFGNLYDAWRNARLGAETTRNLDLNVQSKSATNPVELMIGAAAIGPSRIEDCAPPASQRSKIGGKVKDAASSGSG